MKKHSDIKQLLCILMITAVCPVLSGCNSDADLTVLSETTVSEDAEDQTIHIAASFYPVYALTKMITDGIEGIETTCVVQPSDECLRSYELSDWDASLLGNASCVVIAGGGLESFENSLYNMGDTGPAVITAYYDYDWITNDHILNADSAGTHFTDPSPYIYLCTDGAKAMLQTIEAGIAVLDSEQEEALHANLTKAVSKIDETAAEIKSKAASLKGVRVILMNEALGYTASELGLETEAIFARESGEGLYDTELENCLNLLLECESRIVLIEKQAPETLIEALESAGFTVVKMNTMSAVSSSAGTQGWFDAMLENADSAVKGINAQ